MKYKIRFKFRKKGEWNETIRFDYLTNALEFVKNMTEKVILPTATLYIEIEEKHE